MANILVLGGTSFFGSILVKNLHTSGHKVSVATRGLANDTLDPEIEKLIFDRKNPQSLTTLFKNRQWDILIDQICFSPDDAKKLVDAAGTSFKHYVMTSTGYVYPKTGSQIQEETFQPMKLALREGDRPELNYEEGKRLAEAYIVQNAQFTSSFARFPIVIGKNDPFNRLDFHINKIKTEECVYHPNWNAKVSYVSDFDAARCLQFLAEGKLAGTFNFCSTNITFQEMMDSLSEVIGKKVHKGEEGQCEKSPYAFPGEWTLSTRKLEDAGLQPVTDMLEYLKDLARGSA